jgi:hypothetical protein
MIGPSFSLRFQEFFILTTHLSRSRVRRLGEMDLALALFCLNNGLLRSSSSSSLSM